MTTFFITGTDTDAGKTLITSASLYGLHQQGYQTLGFKPVAAGAEQTAQGLVNDDARLLAQHSSCDVSSFDINPICFEPPIAPHVAAQRAGVNIDSDQILADLKVLQAKTMPGVTLVEGAGGWKVPLDLSGHTLADLPKEERWPVILVVGMKLGCLNHALLTADAMISDGLGLVGWVANCIDPNMDELEANIESLQALLGTPCVGVVPHLSAPTPETVWPYLDEGMSALTKRYIDKGW